MALKAGYKGIKGNVANLIQSLAGAKIIKTIGKGLTLSDSNELSCDIDTDTMEFKDNKLSSKGGSFTYSTTPAKTGMKWIDGKDIYCVVKEQAAVNVPGGPSFTEISLADLNIDTPLMSYISFNDEIVMPWVTDSAVSTIGYKYSKTILGFRKAAQGSAVNLTNMKAILWYTQAEVSN